MSNTMVAILLCLIILCPLCLAEETDYYDWKGLKSFAAKNYTESIVYFDMAIKQDPTYIDAWLHKGDTQRILKDFNGSIASYNAALQIDGKKAVAWSGITEAYTAMKDLTNASIAAAKTTCSWP
jgi:tetratricopeptide (TPR) repeat protein